MELIANDKKNLNITVDNKTYSRGAIKTHFVDVGEDYIELVEKYIKPLYQEGDILSISEKIIALCQKRIITKDDVKPSLLAKILCKCARASTAGPGVANPYKMQFAIQINGSLKVIYAAIMGGLGKLFGKRGVFYEIVGPEIVGLDGFYGDEFDEYANFGIRIPENPVGVCNEIFKKTGIPCMVVDINDISVNILGKGDDLNLSLDFLSAIMKDNPAGQSNECTPFILIRENTTE